MKTSTDFILTTHVGSLPRPKALEEKLLKQEMGVLSEEEAATMPAEVSDAVKWAVQRQRDMGITVIDDGEMSKYAYSTYARQRMTGLTGSDQMLAISDIMDFPEFAKRMKLEIKTPACVGPVSYLETDALRADIANLQAALAGSGAEEGFMNAPSPGIMAAYMPNQYYDTREAYLYALAEAIKTEYDAIVGAGLILQIDCPDLAAGRHMNLPPMEASAFRAEVALLIEVLNHALRDVPADRVRMHLCWGNYEGPHHHDIELRGILDLIYKAKPSALLMEAANPRHAHDWAQFKEMPLPDDKILIPGVIDTCTNYIEHPELVAQRIEQYAGVVGREKVIAGTDCGFATFATVHTIDPDIAWRKLEALAQGAEMASRRLW